MKLFLLALSDTEMTHTEQEVNNLQEFGQAMERFGVEARRVLSKEEVSG